MPNQFQQNMRKFKRHRDLAYAYFTNMLFGELNIMILILCPLSRHAAVTRHYGEDGAEAVVPFQTCAACSVSGNLVGPGTCI